MLYEKVTCGRTNFSVLACSVEEFPLAEFVLPVPEQQPILPNGRVLSEASEQQIFGPWRRCRSRGAVRLCWVQFGVARVRQIDGFVVQRYGSPFRAFGAVGFQRLKIFDPRRVNAENNWTSGLTVVTTLRFTDQTQFSC